MNNSFKFPVGLGMVGAGLAVSAIQKEKNRSDSAYNNIYTGVSADINNDSVCNSNSYTDVTIAKVDVMDIVEEQRKERGFYRLCLTIPFLDKQDTEGIEKCKKEMSEYDRYDYFLPPNFYEIAFMLKDAYEKCFYFWNICLENNPYNNFKVADDIYLQDFVRLDYAIKGKNYLNHSCVVNYHFGSCNKEISYSSYIKSYKQSPTMDKPKQVLDIIENKIKIAKSISEIIETSEESKLSQETIYKDSYSPFLFEYNDAFFDY